MSNRLQSKIMKVKILTYSVLCFILVNLLITGCKPVKEGADGTIELRKKSAEYIQEKLSKHHTDADWFAGKGSIKLKQDGSTLKATAYITMKKDSVIWASVKKLGIEVGRVFVTPDSFFMINRLERSYVAEDVNYLKQQIDFSTGKGNLGDFRALQDIILGNAILDDQKTQVERNSPFYVLIQDSPEMRSSFAIDGRDFRLSRTEILQKGTNRELTVGQSDYKALTTGAIFPYLRKVLMRTPQSSEVEVELNFSRIELNEIKSIRFEIPKHYQRAK